MNRSIHLAQGAIAPLPWQQAMIRVTSLGFRVTSYPAGVLADAASDDAARHAIRKLAEGEADILFIGGDAARPLLTLERMA
jgi:hypothetical protein